MIRPTKSQDVEAILGLAKQALGFDDSEAVQLCATIDEFCSGGGEGFWVTDIDEGEERVVGAAYCAPEVFANAVWNLLFIAVNPDQQGKGRGTALIESIESTLADKKARLLLIETAVSLDKTRKFYIKRGFNEEAKIRDYYDEGEDKIVYLKKLL